MRRIDPSGIITTISGDGYPNSEGDGGPAKAAKVFRPRGIVVDGNDNIFFVEREAWHVRRIQGSSPFDVAPSALQFIFSLNAPPERQIAMVCVSGRVRKVSIVSTVPWLSAVLARTEVKPGTPLRLEATADPKGLKGGSYFGKIILTDPDSGDKTELPIGMSVSNTEQQIRLTPIGLTFTPAEGETNVPPQNFQVVNAGTGTLLWTVSTATTSGGSWLAATPPLGTSAGASVGASVQVSVNPAGLIAGTYFGLVTVTAPTADNSPQSTVVVMDVRPSGQPSIPFDTTPSGLVITTIAGGPAPVKQSIVVGSRAAKTPDLTLSAAYPDVQQWFTLSSLTLKITPSGNATVDIVPSLKLPGSGTYRGTVVIRSPADATSRTVTLLLIVAPASAANQSTSRIGRDATTTCVRSSVAGVYRGPASGFSVSAGWPATIDVQLADNCGLPVTTGKVVTTFSTGDSPVELTQTCQGRWLGTWLARSVKTGMTITTSVETSDPVVRGEVKTIRGLTSGGDSPLINTGGIADKASLIPGFPLAAGSQVRVQGSRLSKEELKADSFPLPVLLGETSTYIGRVALPVFNASCEQVDVAIPYSVAHDTPLQLITRRGNLLSLPYPVIVTNSRPSVFTLTQTGAGAADAFI